MHIRNQKLAHETAINDAEKVAQIKQACNRDQIVVYACNLARFPVDSLNTSLLKHSCFL